jgi:hypothetical protein
LALLKASTLASYSFSQPFLHFYLNTPNSYTFFSFFQFFGHQKIKKKFTPPAAAEFTILPKRCCCFEV